MRIEIPDVSALPKAAADFVGAMGDHRVFAFYGKMGVGKTALIKEICAALHIEDVVNSPTFSIVNEYYRTDTGEAVFHFDFYRIKTLAEVYDMGYEEYFYGGGICLIEWPELIEPLLPEDAVRVSIVENADGSRTVEF